MSSNAAKVQAHNEMWCCFEKLKNVSQIVGIDSDSEKLETLRLALIDIMVESEEVGQRNRMKWEGDVIYCLALLLGIDTGHAQGLVESQSFELARCWGKGDEPLITAHAINRACSCD